MEGDSRQNIRGVPRSVKRPRTRSGLVAFSRSPHDTPRHGRPGDDTGRRARPATRSRRARPAPRRPRDRARASRPRCPRTRPRVSRPPRLAALQPAVARLAGTRSIAAGAGDLRARQQQRAGGRLSAGAGLRRPLGGGRNGGVGRGLPAAAARTDARTRARGAARPRGERRAELRARERRGCLDR